MTHKSFTRNIIIFITPILVLILTSATPPEVPAPAEGCVQVGEVQTGDLASGQSISFPFTLEPGQYTFAAWATWDLISLGMTINGSNGVELTRDEGLDNNPVISIGFEEQTDVVVILTAGADRVSGQAGAFSFVLASGENCYERSVNPTKEILEDYTVIAAENGESVLYWVSDMLFGEDSLMLNYDLEAGDYTIIAETVDESDDIDMYVRRGDEVLAQDEIPNNAPDCIIHLTETTAVSIEIDPWTYGSGNTTDVIVVVTRSTVEKQE
jgi:hypothetical protein